MEIKFKRNTKNKEEKNNRPSKVLVLILALIFVLAGVNLLKTSFDGTSLKPFGFIERIAAVGQANLETITGANATSSIQDEIKDNTDRCIPINPKTGSAMSSGTSMYVGKGGLNQGTLVGGGGEEVAFIQGESDKNKTNLDMGYILRIALGPQDVGSTVNFIKDANENGLTPVVRLCYSPEAGSNCSFDMTVGNDAPNSVAKFYRDIYNSIGAGYSAVFVTGPNEPGTASEMTNFRLRNWDYATLVARTNVIASSLQDLRGSGITLAPAIFNTSNDIGGRYPTGGDFEAYNANGLDWSLFDNILINIYDTKNNNSFEEYKSTGVQSFAGENGLKVIVTEFGLFDKNEPGVKDKFINNFKSLCSETNVDGILFYRSIEELGRLDGPNADTLPVSDIAAMTKACVKLREWLNCNFDSAIYPDNPNKISLVADNLASSNPSCVVRDQTNSRGAALLVKCEGEGCSAKMVKTVKATLPVKFTGSNSSFGTKTKQYYPISAEVAALTDTSEYDPLNQFAGEIAGSDGSRYAMPLLGSAINNSYELAKYMGDFASVPNLQSFPSPGSFTSNLKDEIVTEIQRNIGGAISNPKSISVQQNGVSFIPDERVVSVNGNNFDKTDINTIKSLREYDPYLATTFSDVPNSCTGNMKYLENPDDYIPGPEVIVEEKDVWTGSGGELCRLYGERNNGSPEVDLQTSSNLNCSVNPTRRVPIAGGTALVNCRSVVFCNFAGGRCNINQAYSSCIDYTPKETDQVYIYSKDYGTIPSYQIKDIWDALYSQYTMLQNALKNRGLKMVFQENIGWKAEYTSKIRDVNKTVANAEQNLYSSSPDELTFSQGSISGSAFEPKLFNNKYLTANGQSTINSQQYYDWLGYLDIIQEMRMVYLNSVPLGAEERIDNPYYQKSGAPNSEKEKINLAGQASLISSFPFLTCDQVELCKNKDRLISDFGEEKANKLCPFSKLDTKAQLTCVTDESDDRFEDGLEKQLCQRGYTIEGVCLGTGMQCIKQSEPQNDDYNFNSQEEVILFPVSKSRSIPNCAEPSSVISVPLPVDWDMKYFEENTTPIDISNFKLVPDASAAFVSMMSEMRKDDARAFSQCAINWGYRSRAVQEEEVRQEGSCGTVTACACHSEHQLGTTLDFVESAQTFKGVGSFGSTDCYAWLSNNAHTYGFVNSYGTNDPNNYAAEPWHWRWIGSEYASKFYSDRSSYSRNLLNFLETRPSSGINISNPTNVTCPVANGQCQQGPGGSFSHGKLNAVDLVGENRQVLAPIDGTVVRLVENYCINDTYDAGDGFVIRGTLGGVEREIFFYHVDVRGAGIRIGQTFKVGEPMVQMADIGDITLSGNPINSLNCKNIQTAGYNVHVHVEIIGDKNDPQTNASNVLAGFGCNMNTGADSCTPNSSIDYGGDNIKCMNSDYGYVIANNIYDSFDELVKAIADYAASTFNTFYPAQLLRATVQIETSATDENGKPYGGDPSLVAYENENSAGASGPTQFLSGVFMGIAQSNQTELQGCIESIGLNVPSINPQSRNILGVALCATAIKHNTNMLYFLPSNTFGNIINSSEDWFNRNFSPNTGRADWGTIFKSRGLSESEGERYDLRSDNISAVEVAGRRYYGACYPSLSVQDAGGYNYCTSLYDLAKSYNF